MLNVTTEISKMYRVVLDIRTNLGELYNLHEFNLLRNRTEFLWVSFDTGNLDKPDKFVKVIWATPEFIEQNPNLYKFQLISAIHCFKDKNGIGFEELIESKEGELITNDFYDIEMRYCNTFTIDSNGIIVQANLIS